MFKNDSSAVSVIWYLMGAILVQGINFLTTPIFTNLMSVDNYAMLSICTMWVTVFSAFITLQVHGSVNNALLTYGPTQINEYVSSIQTIELASFSLIFVVSFFSRAALSQIMRIPETIVLVLLATSFFQSCIQLRLAQLVAERRHKRYFALSFIQTVLTVALSIALVILHTNEATKYFGKVFGTLLAVTAVGSIIFAGIYLRGKKFFHSEYSKYCLMLTMPLILHNLSQIVLGQSNRYMLKILLNNDYQVGIYSYGQTLGAMINVLWIAFNYAWVPWYYEKRNKDDFQKIQTIAKYYCFAFTALTICFLLVSPELVKIMAPENYWQGMHIVPITAMGFYFMFLYSFPVNYEFFKEKTTWISVGTMFAGLLNIGINFFLIPSLEALGAALTTLISYGVLFIFHYLIAQFVVKQYEMPFSFFLKPLLPLLIVISLYFIAIDLLVLRWAIALAVAVAAAVYLYAYYRKTNVKESGQ